MMHWFVIDGPALIGANRHARLVALSDRGRAGEALSVEELEECRSLSSELADKVFAQMAGRYPPY